MLVFRFDHAYMQQKYHLQNIHFKTSHVEETNWPANGENNLNLQHN